MTNSTYPDRFQTLTGHQPYPWQAALAAETWPELLSIPTGLGKTQGVLGAWLHKRLENDEGTGRRLVWCLPMRVLVQQTHSIALAMCKAAAPLFEAAGRSAPTVHILLGGEVDRSWEERPTDEAILIGTQDLLLSRALNRGYAMSRYKWPVHFGLLHTDALWVFDETQLLGVGLETSAQLEGLRRQLGTHGRTRTLWMSATLADDRLDTVDHQPPAEGRARASLTPADEDHEPVRRRTQARKALAAVPDLRLDKASMEGGYAASVARFVSEQHRTRGGLTLVVLNQVRRAREVYTELRRGNQQGDADSAPVTGLLHSRFRPGDREAREALLAEQGDRIIVATQVVEAGLDLSARTLITELAPWASLVQRFGRCNRHGELPEGGALWWIDAADDDKTVLLPYDAEELSVARDLLSSTSDAGPATLAAIEHSPPSVVRPVVRRRDLLALFDTSPDLSGEDMDISRFVRDGQDVDVFVYWQAFEDALLPPHSRRASTDASAHPRPPRETLCRVGVGPMREFLKKLEERRKKEATKKGAANEDATKNDAAKNDATKKQSNKASDRLRALVWQPLERQWEVVRAEQVRPGQVVRLDPVAGGYTPELGWCGHEERSPVPSIPKKSGEEAPSLDDDGSRAEEAHADDGETAIGRWIRLEHHLAHVRDEARAFALASGLDKGGQEQLATAGLWHDVGKAHAEFQGRLLDPVQKADVDRAPPADADATTLWAKSSHMLRSKREPHRRFFRHELASMLAWLSRGGADDERERDLVAYLVLAHHGKIRVSLRSLPEERPPADAAERGLAHGVLDGDVIDRVLVPGVGELEQVDLSLDIMRLGEGERGASWLERVLRLRDAPDLGPFRLAYLEGLLRAADWKASHTEQHQGYDDA